MNRALFFSSATPSHATPAAFYAELDAEFHFDLDPCPLNDAPRFDGKTMSWAKRRVFCNPPYGRGIGDWLGKAREADLAVYLLPARTDTRWWHDYALRADEIRFVRGRLRFGEAKTGAPFPSVVLIFDGATRTRTDSPTMLAALRLASRATPEGIAGVLREHEDECQSGEPGYRVQCLGCEWRGPWRDDQNAAYRDYDAHVAERVVAYLKGET